MCGREEEKEEENNKQNLTSHIGFLNIEKG